MMEGTVTGWLGPLPWSFARFGFIMDWHLHTWAVLSVRYLLNFVYGKYLSTVVPFQVRYSGAKIIILFFKNPPHY
jgi:hypothetical protein